LLNNDEFKYRLESIGDEVEMRLSALGGGGAKRGERAFEGESMAEVGEVDSQGWRFQNTGDAAGIRKN